VHSAEVKFLHDVLQRRHAARDVLRLIGKSLQETGSVALAI
jgi:hypothetical protein